MASTSLQFGLGLAGVLFAIGFAGVLVRRNILFVLMSIEIMFNAAALAFVVAGQRWAQPDGQIMFMFILAVTAAEVAIALALVLAARHHFKTLDTDEISRMRG